MAAAAPHPVLQFGGLRRIGWVFRRQGITPITMKPCGRSQKGGNVMVDFHPHFNIHHSIFCGSKR
jgi:hypothetical protein